MEYGVKALRTIAVGDRDLYFYEELILRVQAGSFDEAYKKASEYLKDTVISYTNVNDQTVKTEKIELIDCFLACDASGDIQEVYSSFFQNRTGLTEDVYYRALTSPCDEAEMYPLRNQEFC